MKSLLNITILILTFISCKTYPLSYRHEQAIFDNISNRMAKIMDKNELSAYDITLLVTNKLDNISLKGTDRVFMYLLPYPLLKKEEKLEYEQHFQIVRDLYKTRADFTDEFYNYLWTAQTLSDIYLYGYENDRTLRPSKTINSFAIAFLKEYKFRGFDIARMNEASKRLLTYWQSNTQQPRDDRMIQRQKFSDLVKAIEACKSTNLEQMIKDIKLKNFKKAS